MLYNEFIDCVRKVQTEYVRALSIPSSCVLTQIPRAFQIVIPNIVKLIAQNANQLCQAHQVIAWFGLQVTSGGIQSSLPKQSNRIYYSYYPNVHLCCVLSYLILDKNAFSPTYTCDTWQNYQSLVIDFTTGYLMDSQHYIFQMLGEEGSPGRIYGQLNQKLLKNAWVLAKKEQQQLTLAPTKQDNLSYFMNGAGKCAMKL